jgi:long-chain acyl-CoA synthetase
MQHPWHAHYSAGMPTTIATSGPQTVVALLEHSFATYRDSDAYVCMGHTLRYGDVDALSTALAAWLQAQPLQQGDCVAIMLPNLLGFPVAMAAVLRAGFVAVNINPLYTPRELQHQLVDSGAKAIVVLDRFAPTLEAVVAYTQVATPGPRCQRSWVAVAALSRRFGRAAACRTSRPCCAPATRRCCNTPAAPPG